MELGFLLLALTTVTVAVINGWKKGQIRSSGGDAELPKKNVNDSGGGDLVGHTDSSGSAVTKHADYNSSEAIEYANPSGGGINGSIINNNNNIVGGNADSGSHLMDFLWGIPSRVWGWFFKAPSSDNGAPFDNKNAEDLFTKLSEKNIKSEGLRFRGLAKRLVPKNNSLAVAPKEDNVIAVDNSGFGSDIVQDFANNVETVGVVPMAVEKMTDSTPVSSLTDSVIKVSHKADGKVLIEAVNEITTEIMVEIVVEGGLTDNIVDVVTESVEEIVTEFVDLTINTVTTNTAAEVMIDTIITVDTTVEIINSVVAENVDEVLIESGVDLTFESEIMQYCFDGIVAYKLDRSLSEVGVINPRLSNIGRYINNFSGNANNLKLGRARFDNLSGGDDLELSWLLNEAWKQSEIVYDDNIRAIIPKIYPEYFIDSLSELNNRGISYFCSTFSNGDISYLRDELSNWMMRLPRWTSSSNIGVLDSRNYTYNDYMGGWYFNNVSGFYEKGRSFYIPRDEYMSIAQSILDTSQNLLYAMDLNKPYDVLYFASKQVEFLNMNRCLGFDVLSYRDSLHIQSQLQILLDCHNDSLNGITFEVVDSVYNPISFNFDMVVTNTLTVLEYFPFFFN